MAFLLARRCLAATLALIVTVALPRLAGADGTNNMACFDIRVDYLGRVPVQNVSGVQYYRWSYKVTGTNCINRGLSHWTLALCTQTTQSLSQISQQSSDNTNIGGGLMSTYHSEVGKDLTTGISGLKWDFVGGNAINMDGECDEFSFVASGTETSVAWAAKGARIVVSGTTMGPACAPVPVEGKSWSSIKALFRS
ncbi:MAG: hypothetical protein SGI90_06530 [Candidatus Eisenbacteria bacterium]|nr:hypothetical protein [Candidatus Eisenbacteria bacterium]